MIDERTKSQAIARMKMQHELEDIADDLDIPLKLLKDWKEKFDPADMTEMTANIIAIDNINNSTIIIENKEEVLKGKLEDAAIDIAKQASSVAISGDMVAAKAVQLAADSVVKLYGTIVMKGGTGEADPGKTSSNPIFQQLMKD